MRIPSGFLVAALLLVSAAPRPWRAPELSGLLDQGRSAGWDTLPMGECVARFGLALEGAPYRAGTLEGPGPEVCRVTTLGFDCVTFMELSLDLARTLRREGEPTEQDVRDAIAYTRYRGGHVEGYASRLHYTADWIEDNVAKGVIADMTPALGGVRYPVDTRFMTEHPEHYAPLRSDPAQMDAMRAVERRLRASLRTFVPKESVAGIEARLLTGDLVAITTSVPGLDYAHTGIVVRDSLGARLLHASSARGRVVLDTTIAGVLARGPANRTGISVLRPLDPRAALRR